MKKGILIKTIILRECQKKKRKHNRGTTLLYCKNTTMTPFDTSCTQLYSNPNNIYINLTKLLINQQCREKNK